MTPDQFKTQIARLQSRFGDKAFDNEFVKLAWRTVEGMRLEDFTKCIDTWLGSRRPHDPPMIAEFREQRLLVEKARVNWDAQAACKVLRHPAMVTPVTEILRKEFGEVGSVAEAFRVAKRRMRDDGDPA